MIRDNFQPWNRERNPKLSYDRCRRNKLIAGNLLQVVRGENDAARCLVWAFFRTRRNRFVLRTVSRTPAAGVGRPSPHPLLP